MGVPSFYRWLVKRYPGIVVNAVEDRVVGGGDQVTDSSDPNPNGIEFDNLYLDMNGIIHPCFHPDDHLFPPTTVDEVFNSIFEYIDRLFKIVRPRNLLYLAIDGVAPRAKMNQQRSRRFRAAKEAQIADAEEERLRKEFEMYGKKLLPKLESQVSDPTVITPGTEFMYNLSKALQYYVRLRLTTDPGWKKIKVILSDSNVPGEGEHKIMEFIRLQRNLPGYDPNTRHCLYGLDADLIMLALATHELHFAVLREDVLNLVPQPICTSSLESALSKAVTPPEWLPNAQGNNKAAASVKKPYQFLNIWTLREFLELDLQINNPAFGIDFERIVDDFICICLFIGNDFLLHMPSLQINEGAIDLMMSVYKEDFNRRGGYLVDMQKVEGKKVSHVNLKSIENFILAVGSYEERIFKKRHDLQQSRIKKFLRENADDVEDQATEQEDPLVQAPIGSLHLKSMEEACTLTDAKSVGYSASASNVPPPSEDSDVLQNTKELKRRLKDLIRDQSDLFKKNNFGDKVRLGVQGWRQRYYMEKFSVKSPLDIDGILKDVVKKYIEGICWVLQYYFHGVPSWTWFYPYHYAPFASDLKGIGRINIKFNMGAPFRPFDQLMGVLPPSSAHLLPEVYWDLMTTEESPLKEFYPTEFIVDVDGKRFLWQGIAKLPFINEEKLILATWMLESELKEDETKRNSVGKDMLFISDSHALAPQVSSLVCADRKQRNSRMAIDVTASDGMNGFICPCGDDLPNIAHHVKGTEDVSRVDAKCVIFELPESHPHSPRLLENVSIPLKTVTEEDIVKTPLWHEYDGWMPPVRPQSLQRYKQIPSADSPSGNEVFKGAGSGWRATGRGIGHLNTSPNSQSPTGIGAANWRNTCPSNHPTPLYSTVQPNRQTQAVNVSYALSCGSLPQAGRGRAGIVGNQTNWRGHEFSGISNVSRGGSRGRSSPGPYGGRVGGRGSSSPGPSEGRGGGRAQGPGSYAGLSRGTHIRNGSFWQSKNAQTNDPQL